MVIPVPPPDSPSTSRTFTPSFIPSKITDSLEPLLWTFLDTDTFLDTAMNKTRNSGTTNSVLCGIFIFFGAGQGGRWGSIEGGSAQGHLVALVSRTPLGPLSATSRPPPHIPSPLSFPPDHTPSRPALLHSLLSSRNAHRSCWLQPCRHFSYPPDP